MQNGKLEGKQRDIFQSQVEWKCEVNASIRQKDRLPKIRQLFERYILRLEKQNASSTEATTHETSFAHSTN